MGGIYFFGEESKIWNGQKQQERLPAALVVELVERKLENQFFRIVECQLPNFGFEVIG